MSGKCRGEMACPVWVFCVQYAYGVFVVVFYTNIELGGMGLGGALL